MNKIKIKSTVNKYKNNHLPHAIPKIAPLVIAPNLKAWSLLRLGYYCIRIVILSISKYFLYL